MSTTYEDGLIVYHYMYIFECKTCRENVVVLGDRKTALQGCLCFDENNFIFVGVIKKRNVVTPYRGDKIVCKK